MPVVPNKSAVGFWLLCTTLSLVACGTPEPPLEQLELRDALLAEPAVIAGLTPEAQQRLAGRFWAAMATPDLATTVALSPSTPEQRLRHFDTQRQQRGQDAFLAGVWAQSAATQTLTPLAQLGRSAPAVTLPPLLGPKSTVTATQELRALAGRAGAVIEELRGRSGALYLQRVTGWPVAVVAIEDRVYVNATWLTAVAALESAELPKDPGAATSAQAGQAGQAGQAAADEGGELAAHAATTQPQAVDPGTLAPDATPPAASASGGFGSCSSCSSSSCSSCGSSGKSSSCDYEPCSEDKQCCRACTLAPERRTPDLAPLWLLLWLGMPLVLLASVDVWNRAARRRAKDRADTESP